MQLFFRQVRDDGAAYRDGVCVVAALVRVSVLTNVCLTRLSFMLLRTLEPECGETL